MLVVLPLRHEALHDMTERARFGVIVVVDAGYQEGVGGCGACLAERRCTCWMASYFFDMELPSWYLQMCRPLPLPHRQSAPHNNHGTMAAPNHDEPPCQCWWTRRR